MSFILVSRTGILLQGFTKMKNQNLIAGLFWLMVGLLLSVWSTQYQIGGVGHPGAGFLPLLLGLVLILLSLFLLLRGTKKVAISAQEASNSSLSRGWTKVAYTSLILILATFLFEKIGYLFTIFLLVVFLMWGGRTRAWKTILLVALLSTLSIYFLFVLLLKQQLPRGLLGI